MKGFNLKEFNIDIDLKNKKYCIEDKITGVKYYGRNVEEHELHERLKTLFKRIEDYREWWYEIERKENN